jgi:hypothetical protein
LDVQSVRSTENEIWPKTPAWKHLPAQNALRQIAFLASQAARHLNSIAECLNHNMDIMTARSQAHFGNSLQKVA